MNQLIIGIILFCFFTIFIGLPVYCYVCDPAKQIIKQDRLLEYKIENI